MTGKLKNNIVYFYCAVSAVNVCGTYTNNVIIHHSSDVISLVHDEHYVQPIIIQLTDQLCAPYSALFCSVIYLMWTLGSFIYTNKYHDMCMYIIYKPFALNLTCLAHYSIFYRQTLWQANTTLNAKQKYFTWPIRECIMKFLR